MLAFNCPGTLGGPEVVPAVCAATAGAVPEPAVLRLFLLRGLLLFGCLEEVEVVVEVVEVVEEACVELEEEVSLFCKPHGLLLGRFGWLEMGALLGCFFFPCSRCV